MMKKIQWKDNLLKEITNETNGFIDWHVHIGDEVDFLELMDNFSTDFIEIDGLELKGVNLILNTHQEVEKWKRYLKKEVLKKMAAGNKFIFVTIPILATSELQKLSLSIFKAIDDKDLGEAVTLLRDFLTSGFEIFEKEIRSIIGDTANERYSVILIKVHPRLIVEEFMGFWGGKSISIAGKLRLLQDLWDLIANFMILLKHKLKRAGYKKVGYFVDCFSWGDAGSYSFKFLETLSFYLKNFGNCKSERLLPEDIVICHACSHWIKEFEMKFYRPFNRRFWIDLSAVHYFSNSKKVMMEFEEFVRNLNIEKTVIGTDWPLVLPEFRNLRGEERKSQQWYSYVATFKWILKILLKN